MEAANLLNKGDNSNEQDSIDKQNAKSYKWIYILVLIVYVAEIIGYVASVKKASADGADTWPQDHTDQ